MAKRFTSTEKWSDPWFRKLTPRLKCLWDWLFTQCDIAGSIDPDWGLASFQIGQECTIKDVDSFGKRIVVLPGGRLHLTKFIQFQYGCLTSNCRAHIPVMSLCDRLSIDYTYPMDSDKEQDKEKEQEQVQEQAQEQEEEKAKTWRTCFEKYQDEELSGYENLIGNPDYIAERKTYHPGLDVSMTLQKAHHDYWSTHAGWKNKKQSRTKEIDWKATYNMALTMKTNQVWDQRTRQQFGRQEVSNEDLMKQAKAFMERRANDA